LTVGVREFAFEAIHTSILVRVALRKDNRVFALIAGNAAGTDFDITDTTVGNGFAVTDTVLAFRTLEALTTHTISSRTRKLASTVIFTSTWSRGLGKTTTK
jgi:hypothetical protein